MVCMQCGAQLTEGQNFCSQCGSSVGLIPAADSLKVSTAKSPYLTKIILAVTLTIGLVYFAMTLTRNYHPVIADQPSTGYGTNPGQNKIESKKIAAAMEGNDIVIDVETVIKSGIVRFFDPEGIQPVPVIAYVTPRGKIVTAMSISESCRSQDFYLEGNTIHCANCPSYWHMESLEAYACCQKYYPDPIASTVERGMLRIPKLRVQEWKTRI